MQHPFAELIDLQITEQRAGFSKCALTIDTKHLNPHQIAHGAVLYAMVDTGMGSALYPSWRASVQPDKAELVATANGNYSLFKPSTRAP